MRCKEKELLRERYGETTARFAQIVAKLQRQVGDLSEAEYESRLQLAQDAQIISEAARIEFERHIEEHQC